MTAGAVMLRERNGSWTRLISGATFINDALDGNYPGIDFDWRCWSQWTILMFLLIL